MKKIDWLIVLLAVPLVWAIDAYTKSFALKHITGVTFWGPIGLVLHKNPGAMFGMFSDLPPILRVVSLSTGGAFLFFIYAFAQYLLPKRLFSLRIGLSFLLGGILGNVTDRVLWGEVVDFLLIGTPRYSTPAFNFADAIQWVGYLLVVISLLKQGRAFWPDDNERKKVWVHPKFQFKYIFVLIIIGLSFSIISGVFTYTYLKITIDDLAPINSLYFEKKFIPPFLITFAIISLFFLIALFIIGKILSHRTAGPLYAFELYIEDLLKNNFRSLRLREGDEFQHLEELAHRLKEKMQSCNKDLLSQETNDNLSTKI